MGWCILKIPCCYSERVTHEVAAVGFLFHCLHAGPAKYIQVQTLVQVDWEPGPTEIVPNWAPHLIRLALSEWFFAICPTIQIAREETHELPLHWLLFLISNKGSYVYIIPQYHGHYYTSCGKRSSQWVHK